MKKVIILASMLFSVFSLFAQEKAPSMKGYWYCPTTQQMLVIRTDKDDTVQGTGVLFSENNGRFATMQIMTQSPQLAEHGDYNYTMKIYDPKKPKMVYNLTSEKNDGQIVIWATLTGNRSKIYYFYNLNDNSPLEKNVPIGLVLQYLVMFC
jgi:WD40 repeat protein